MRARSCIVLAAVFGLAAGAANAQPTTVYVSPVSGNPAASGAALLDALAGITDNSAAKPYVLKLDPGIYDLGATSLVMKPYVDVEGSGQGSTTVRGPGNDDFPAYATAIVVGGVAAELRNLTVSSVGQASQAASLGIYMGLPGVGSIRDVTVVSGGATANWGIRNQGASPTIQNVTIDVSGGGDESYGISVTYDLMGDFSYPIIKHTVINVTGPVNQGYGVYIDGISVPQDLRDLEIAVNTSGTVAYGLYATTQAAGEVFQITGSTVTATGAANNYGAYIDGAQSTDLEAETTYLKATGGTSYGAYATSYVNLGVVGLNQCEVSGGTGSISILSGYAHDGASRTGGAVTAGLPACAAAYSATYSPLSGTCQ
jgi:hypothetical protein